ncbi:acyl carrier protein [Corallincola luteus]|uniref:Acyl carrier protein n=2 Tax=Corallincola TaxID=1775176 RepID=A0A368NQF9_9GAMM|nr:MULTISPECIES: acyl carrier protein [Corallincola]RCU52782.1 acyl carrier protein [Corallincola holothuriorum]TCI03283.1 acyl carrier protein [Corallincola luteus]
MYTKEQILDEVRSAMVDLFELNPAEITVEANLYKDLDLDSIDAVDLVVRMQNFTGEKLAPNQFKSVRTVGDVVEAIAGLVR